MKVGEVVFVKGNFDNKFIIQDSVDPLGRILLRSSHNPSLFLSEFSHDLIPESLYSIAATEEPKKLDNSKPRLDLIRPEFTLAVGYVLGYGADKYSEKVGEIPNYLKGNGLHYSRLLGSLERHIQEFKMGVNIDDESGRSHLAHAAANIMFLLTYEESDKGIDDRVKLKKNKDK